MRVADIEREARDKQKQDVRLFNPGLEDFKVKQGEKEHLVRAMEISTFKQFEADHIEKHLADFVMNQRGLSKDTDRQKVIEEIRVK